VSGFMAHSRPVFNPHTRRRSPIRPRTVGVRPTRYEEWVLPDPAGQALDAIRPIRNETEQRVRTLLSQLQIPPQASAISPVA
jgi:hypothetical protein